MRIIEALASGTPVIAWADTAAAAIIEDGVSGFVVRNSDAALAAIAKVATLERRACRRLFEDTFDSRHTAAAQYLQLYARLLHARDAAIVAVASCRRAGPPHS
jgi:glycosyltransferase involved in cell wall biosynthesis